MVSPKIRTDATFDFCNSIGGRAAIKDYLPPAGLRTLFPMQTIVLRSYGPSGVPRRVGGGQISGTMELRTGGPDSYAKFSALKKGKRPLD